MKNELIVKTHGYMQNEREKLLAFEREDAMRAKLEAALAQLATATQHGLDLERQLAQKTEFLNASVESYTVLLTDYTRVITERNGLEAQVGRLRRDSERLDLLIKQGPPGANEGVGLNKETWDLAICQISDDIRTDAEAVRLALDATHGLTSATGGDNPKIPLQNETKP